MTRLLIVVGGTVGSITLNVDCCVGAADAVDVDVAMEIGDAEGFPSAIPGAPKEGLVEVTGSEGSIVVEREGSASA